MIDSPETLEKEIAKLRKAQKIYSEFGQAALDKIFKTAALAANKARIRLAKMAASETGMGVVEDKVIKNNYASEYIYNEYKNTKTTGIIDEDTAAGIIKIAESVGIITAVIPTTNPTSTAIFKCLLALKTGNGILISPHPRAKKCTAEAARTVLSAAVSAGAPPDIIKWIDVPSTAMSDLAMKSADLILATGGPGMVKAAYSSGKPAIGVGAGNTPAIITETADIKLAVNSIIISKTFDNGMICASEQSVIVSKAIYNDVKKEFIDRGCYILSSSEIKKVRKTIIINGALNAKIVGQTAAKIAELSDIKVPPETKILIGEVTSVSLSEEFAHEKLSPVLAMYKSENFEESLKKAERLIEDGGLGHTASIYLDEAKEKENFALFCQRMRTCRILLNTPSSHGGIGGLYNFSLVPSLTLGCGSYGGNSVSENVGVKHLLNIKTVAKRSENMLWFRTPQKIFIKKNCLSGAMTELSDKKRIFIVTDNFLYKNHYLEPVLKEVRTLGANYSVFFDVDPDPNLSCAKKGAAQMSDFAPDCVIAFGGGSAIDAAKIMWVLYEHPDADFDDMAMRFMDIRKRIYAFPKMGLKADFVAIPTTAGTGSEVTPFAVITGDPDENGNTIKFPLADYELLPDMAIVDAALMKDCPPSLTAASGIDALTHALESYVSMLATSFTDSLAKEAIKEIFEWLPLAFDDGSNMVAREHTAHAATIAGMAFANAFLGICHSMAHKLGSYHHLPHGIANALLINYVIKFNASDTPTKMGTFPQYDHPKALEKYNELARFLYIPVKSAEDKYFLVDSLCIKIDALKEKIGIKKTIAEYGVSEKDFLETLDEMSEAAFDDQCTGANPRYPLISEIKEIYKKAYYGGEK